MSTYIAWLDSSLDQDKLFKNTQIQQMKSSTKHSYMCLVFDLNPFKDFKVAKPALVIQSIDHHLSRTIQDFAKHQGSGLGLKFSPKELNSPADMMEKVFVSVSESQRAINN